MYQTAMFDGADVEIITSDSWCTPSWIADLAFDALGGIDLDPCSNPRSRIRSRAVWVEADDGLMRPWFGSVWCNMPYSDPAPWLRRCAEHDGPVIAMPKGDWSTAWWQRYVRPAPARCELARRVRFDRPDKPPITATFPSVLVYWGGEVERFADLFGPHGQIVRGDA